MPLHTRSIASCEVAPSCEQDNRFSHKSFGRSDIPFLRDVIRGFPTHPFVGPMIVEVTFEAVEDYRQLRDAVETEAVGLGPIA